MPIAMANSPTRVLARVRQHGDGQPPASILITAKSDCGSNAPQFRREAAAVPEPDLDALRVLDHVAVGEDVAVGADDDAGAFAAHPFGKLLLELSVKVSPELARQRVKQAV